MRSERLIVWRWMLDKALKYFFEIVDLDKPIGDRADWF